MKLLTCIAIIAFALTTTHSLRADEAENKARAKELYSKALDELARNDYAAACPHLEEVVRLVPEAVGGMITLAECHEEAGHLTEALKVYQRAEKAAAEQKDEARRKKAADRIEALEMVVQYAEPANRPPVNTTEAPAPAPAPPPPPAPPSTDPGKGAPAAGSATPQPKGAAPPPKEVPPQPKKPASANAPVSIGSPRSQAAPQKNTRQWYGYQTLIVHGLGISLTGLGLGVGAWPLIIGGPAVGLLGPSTVHWVHGHGGRGFGALGMYVGMIWAPTVLGTFIGDSSSTQSIMHTAAPAIGFSLGYLGAITIDVAKLAYDDPDPSTAHRQKGPSLLLPSSMAVIPMLDKNVRGLSLVGQF